MNPNKSVYMPTFSASIHRPEMCAVTYVEPLTVMDKIKIAAHDFMYIAKIATMITAALNSHLTILLIYEALK